MTFLAASHVPACTAALKERPQLRLRLLKEGRKISLLFMRHSGGADGQRFCSGFLGWLLSTCPCSVLASTHNPKHSSQNNSYLSIRCCSGLAGMCNYSTHTHFRPVELLSVSGLACLWISVPTSVSFLGLAFRSYALQPDEIPNRSRILRGHDLFVLSEKQAPASVSKFLLTSLNNRGNSHRKSRPPSHRNLPQSRENAKKSGIATPIRAGAASTTNTPTFGFGLRFEQRKQGVKQRILIPSSVTSDLKP